MFGVRSTASKWIARFALALAICAAPAVARAWTYTILHKFTYNDGAGPLYGSLIKDKVGNLYGTTEAGGAYGSGTVFKLASDGSLSLLHSFNGCCDSDGAHPFGGVIRDSSGNLYGTTYDGGASGNGTVFRLAPDGTETILHAFEGSDGIWPTASLTKDGAGNLYGTASEGGQGYCPEGIDGNGCGTAFRVAPDGTFAKLHDFTQDDGEGYPNGLTRDGAGNLYGTTGGNPFAGTVFRLAPDGTETILHNFCSQLNCTDGLWPFGRLTMDKAGNLYGTTQFGGQRSDGAVFELASDGTETVLGSFDGRNGSEPLGGAIRDRAGNLYGTTARGGTSDDGVVFKLTADGRLKILHSFDCAHDGCDPLAGLLKDGAGNLYGTTYSGGSYNNGTVFELVK